MSKKVIVPVVVVVAGLLIATGALLGVVLAKDHDSGQKSAPASTAVSSSKSSGVTTGKGFLGVSVATGAGGLRVTSLQSDGPAAKAGLQAGDIVRSVDGKIVRTPAELRTAVEAKKPGDDVTLTYERDADEKRAEVKLGDEPTTAQVEASPTPAAGGTGSFGSGLGINRGRLGVIALAITPALKQRYNLKQDSGVVISNVAPNSAAATAGMQAGDVVAMVGQTTISTPDDLQQAVTSAPADTSTEIKVKRGDQEMTLSVKLAAAPSPGMGYLEDLIPPAAREQIRRALSQGAMSVQQLQNGLQDFASNLKVGTVKSVSGDSLTLQPFGGGDQVSLALSADTTVRRLGKQIQASELKQDDAVFVISKDGGKTAMTVIDIGSLAGAQ